MELQSLCCNFDLEDKLSLSQLKPSPNIPLALCVIDPRPTAIYQPPKSTSTQALICRFMQEAIHAQFHLLALTHQELNESNLHRCLKLAEQQLEFFLEKHQWQACIHATILIPIPSNNHLQVVYVGTPTLFALSGSLPNEPESPQDGVHTSKSQRRGFGTSYPFSLEIHDYQLHKCERFIMGFLAWQPLRSSRAQDLLHSRWDDLPEVILDMLNNQELSGHPFFLIQITLEKTAWIENLKRLLRSSLYTAKRLTGAS